MYKYRLTVFTPTYNRGYIIENLYNSLKDQTFKDFEWVVIDDGSTDNTEELFKVWINEKNDFSIKYIKRKNGGKHRAINQGVEIAQGELFFIVDSDDKLINKALEIIDIQEMSIPKEKKKEFAGVCGNKGYTEKDIIGSTFDNEILDITMLEREKNGIYGDKAEVFYTDILKRYKFPEFEGENFITECVVWDRIAYDKYKLRFFNKIIYIGDYLEDGLTKQGNQVFKNNPKGYALFLTQRAKYDRLSLKKRVNKYEQYYSLLNKDLTLMDMAKNLNTTLLIITWIDIKFKYINIITEMCRYKDYYIKNERNMNISDIASQLEISVIYLRLILMTSRLRNNIKNILN